MELALSTRVPVTSAAVSSWKTDDLLVFWHAKVLIGMKRGARSEPALRLMQQCRLSLGWTELLNLEMTQPEHYQEYLVHQVLLRQRRIIAR
jgi:hypothetical protein